jgi:hypothetical protein
MEDGRWKMEDELRLSVWLRFRICLLPGLGMKGRNKMGD